MNANHERNPQSPNSPPLLERLRSAARARGDSEETTGKLVAWARAYILFHNKRCPAQLGLSEATHFLEHVVKTDAGKTARTREKRDILLYRSGMVLNPIGSRPGEK